MIIKYPNRKAGVTEYEFTSPGFHSFICPMNVNSVNVLVVGAGHPGSEEFIVPRLNWAGGSGAMAWKNGIQLTPGQEYTFHVGDGSNVNALDSFFISRDIVGAQGGVKNGPGAVLAGSGGTPGLEAWSLSPGASVYHGAGQGGKVNSSGNNRLVIIRLNKYFPGE